MIKGNIIKTCVEKEKGIWAETDTPVFVSGKGLEGDRHFGDETNQICLMDEEVRKSIDADPEKGFCYKKIHENVLTSGIAYEDLKAGDRIELDGTVLEITAAGKHCYPDLCDLAKSGEKCPLRGGIAFANVI